MPHRILVVDDEPDLEDLIRQRFRRRIRADELTFLFAANGEEALARLEADNNLDVVLTDINMPVMDGLTLLSKLREAHPLLRSVIVSAYGDMANIRTALNRGAFDFVTKPIDFQDLEITLDKAIADALMKKQAASDRDRLLGIHRELELARSIQEALIPRNFPRDPRFEIYGAMTPAIQVGGDLFDFFLLDSGRLMFAIGDVSGKGIAASIFMAVSRTVLRVAAGKQLAPHECMQEVNRFLRREAGATSVYLTCFYGILDLETGTVDFCRAGHNPPHLIRSDSHAPHAGVEALEAGGGLPLGLFDGPGYESASVRLEPGDALILFTDGVTEALNPNGDFYGEERLRQLLHHRARNMPMDEVVREVTHEAISFAAGSQAADDMTVLGIRFLGKDPFSHGRGSA